MAKKKAVKKKKASTTTTVTIDVNGNVSTKQDAIAPLPTDMGREDLNLMAHKINEIIEKYG